MARGSDALSMIAASLTGIWAATQQAASDYQWVPGTPPLTQHDFLVVRKEPDGSLTAFIRNPESNAGAFIGTRTLEVHDSVLRWRRPGRPDIAGEIDPDGSVSLNGLRFYRASAAELQHYYPLQTTVWHYSVPAVLPDGWPVSTLADAGMREGPIAGVMNGILALRDPVLTSPYIQSISIERHGKLVLDQYFYGLGPGDLHDVRSAGKSVTTLMVGRAIEETRAFSPSSRVLDILARYRPVKNDDPRKERMTVGNLMTMAPGLACDDNDEQSPGNEDTMQSQPAGTDWYRYTLDLPMMSEPGTRAIYCSAGINLLGAIVQTETHEPLDRYFAQRFAATMQFGNYAMWLMPPPANAAYMAGGDRFRPRDFLKFGALILNDGKWKNATIVDAGWIRDSIAVRTAPEGEGDRYGYGWHLSTIDVDGRTYAVINAGGNGGQLMIAIPSLDIAIMVTAGNYGQYSVWRQFLPEIATAVIRSCADPDSNAR